ncbi:MAG: hypothetical protein PHE54_01815 [Bacilli bacterium]|nr:hypothetical protein [Bacilli bacterium]
MNKIETVINIFTIDKGEVKILLWHKKNEPYKGYWTLPVKELDEETTMEDNVNEILISKIGFEILNEQNYLFSNLDRYPDKRVLAASFVGIIDIVSFELKKDITDNIEYQWFSISSIPKMAFDHAIIIEQAIKYLSTKLVNSNILKSLFPSDFTLPEVQKVYEQILNKNLDRRNFRKKFINFGLIEDTGYKNEGFNGRPAKLYRFKENITSKELF